MPKGITSKETVETRSYDKKLFVMVKFPNFLGSTSYLFPEEEFNTSTKLNNIFRMFII